MHKINISSPARPSWSEWHVSTPFFITQAGLFQRITLSFYADSVFQDTLSIQLRYYKNGWQNEQRYIGFGDEIQLDVGGDTQDEMHTVKFRVQNNSSAHIVQGITLTSSHAFATESGLQHEFGKSREETEFEQEIEYYKDAVETYKTRIQQGVSNVFGGGSSGASALSFVGKSSYSRSNSLSLEGLISSQIGRASSGIVDRIIGNNPSLFQASIGRVFSQSIDRFADALAKGRIRSMEDAFSTVLGSGGADGFATSLGGQLANGLLESGMSKLFGGTKSRTYSYETTRSLEAANAYRLSQGQQAAEALAALKKGERNL